MIAHQKRYKDIVVFLDGSTFVGCTFTNCTLVFSGYMPAWLDGCTFEADCTWQFSGPAANVLQHMAMLYAQGGDAHDLIEHTFQSIREGGMSPSGPVTLN